MLDHSVLPQSSTKPREMKTLPYVTNVLRTFLATRYPANGVPPTELRVKITLLTEEKSRFVRGYSMLRFSGPIRRTIGVIRWPTGFNNGYRRLARWNKENVDKLSIFGP